MVELELLASPETIINQLNTIATDPFMNLDYQGEKIPSLANIRTWLFHPFNNTKRTFFVSSDLKTSDAQYGKVYVEKGQRNKDQGIYELLIVKTNSQILLKNNVRIPNKYLLLLYAEKNEDLIESTREDYVKTSPWQMSSIIPTKWLLRS